MKNPRRLLVAALPILALSGTPAVAGSAGADYAQAKNWVCRPGAEGRCTGALDVLSIAPDGRRTVLIFTPAPAPPIDCFYIYPTVSEERTAYSDLRLTAAVAGAVHDQAGRLASLCRLFAPIYRQLTGAGLGALLAAHAAPDWRIPYADVLAAWHWYMAHENNGRAVVLIGHSQGSILLHQLLAHEIDGTPAQKILLAAFLPGDLSLPVARGQNPGGAFRKIPLCRRNDQTGCVYVWNSYAAADRTPGRYFGSNPPPPLAAFCASPASPGGGAGDLQAYFAKPEGAPASDPPFVSWQGALTGQCAADAQGNVLRVTVRHGRFAAAANAALLAGVQGDPPTWGLHGMDLDLLQGNVLARVRDETTAWLTQHGTSPLR